MPWNVEANCPFARLLYRRFIVERRPSIQDLETRTGIPESTLKSWCNGGSQIPLWVLPVLAIHVDDPEFFSQLSGAEAIDFLVMRRPKRKATPDDLRTTALRMNGEAGRVGISVADALDDDGEVDTQKLAEIEIEINRLQRLAEALREILRTRVLGDEAKRKSVTFRGTHWNHKKKATTA